MVRNFENTAYLHLDRPSGRHAFTLSSPGLPFVLILSMNFPRDISFAETKASRNTPVRARGPVPSRPAPPVYALRHRAPKQEAAIPTNPATLPKPWAKPCIDVLRPVRNIVIGQVYVGGRPLM